jgi:uncharacterized protein YkwD
MNRRLLLPMLVGLLGFTGTSILPLPSSGASTSGSTLTGVSSLTAMSTSEFETRLLSRANHRRDARGCRRFRLNSALVLAARRHSTAMADRRELSHRLSGEADLAVRITRAGYTNWRMLAENLAWGQSSPRAVFRAWVHSPGHRANLDNCRLRDIGFGVVMRNGRPWVTADFGRRRS